MHQHPQTNIEMVRTLMSDLDIIGTHLQSFRELLQISSGDEKIRIQEILDEYLVMYSAVATQAYLYKIRYQVSI